LVLVVQTKDPEYLKHALIVRYKMLTTMTKKVAAYWNVTPCTLPELYQSFSARQQDPLKLSVISTRQHGVTSRKRAISTHEPFFVEMVSFPASLQFLSLLPPQIPTLFAPLYKYRANPKGIMSPGLLLLF
jgi:hypothetical protein